MGDVVLIRHGQTAWSMTGQHTGRTDIGLTDVGRRQALQLAGMLADREFTRVLSSPLRRALDTCRVAGFGDVAELRDDLMEWDYGVYEGRTTDEVRATAPGWTIWTHPVIDGESVDAVGRRVDGVIADARRVDGDVAIFAHGHLLRVLGARWVGMPPMEGRALALHTATVSVLGWYRETPAIRLWNMACHLRGVEVEQ